MKWKLVILYFLFSSNVFSQYFSKHLDIENGVDFGLQVEIINQEILIYVKGANIAYANHEFAQLLNFDMEGELNWEKKYLDVSRTKKNNLTFDYENEYIYLDNYLWNSDEEIRVLKVDFDGEEILHTDFGADMEWERVFNLMPSADGYILPILYREQQSNNSIVKNFFLDEALNIISDKIVSDQSTAWARVGMGVATIDNGYLLTSSINSPLLGYYHGRFQKIDSLGNLQWETYVEPLPQWDITEPMVVQLSNGSYVGHSYKDFSDLPPNLQLYDFPPMIFGMDTLGNKTWEYIFETHGTVAKELTQMIVADNGDIIGVGSNDNIWIGEDHFWGGWIFRMTSTGEVLWDRTIIETPDIGFNWFNDVKELDNGDLVITGVFSDTFPMAQDVWLIKLDANGCMGAECDSLFIVKSEEIIIPSTDLDIFSISPNPVSDCFALSKGKDHNDFNSQGLSIRIMDMSGKKVLSLEDIDLYEDIDIRHLTSGTYMVEIRQKGQFVQVLKVIKL